MIQIKKILTLLCTIKTNLQAVGNTLFAKHGRGPNFVYAWWTFIVAQIAFLVGKFERMTDFVRYVLGDDPGARLLQQEAGLTDDRLPHRRTFERRMGRLPSMLNRMLIAPAAIMEERGVIAPEGRMLDTTPTLARGNVWHRKHKE